MRRAYLRHLGIAVLIALVGIVIGKIVESTGADSPSTRRLAMFRKGGGPGVPSPRFRIRCHPHFSTLCPLSVQLADNPLNGTIAPGHHQRGEAEHQSEPLNLVPLVRWAF